MSEDSSWDELIDILRNRYGQDCCDLVTPTQLYLYVGGNRLVAIFQKKSPESRMTLHLRAGLPPNMAAELVHYLNNKQAQFALGAIFEVTGERKMLHGIDALKYVADHIHHIWFDEADDYEDIEAEEKRRKAVELLKAMLGEKGSATVPKPEAQEGETSSKIEKPSKKYPGFETLIKPDDYLLN